MASDSAPSNTRRSSSLSSSSSERRPQTLLELVESTPPLLTRVLVSLAPSIASLRRLLEIISWSPSSWTDSWLVLFAWCGSILLSELIIKYLLPPTVALTVLVILPRLYTASTSTLPTTDESLNAAITDLVAIHDLLPRFTPLHETPAAPVIIRVVLICYPAYLILTYFVRARNLTLILGSIVLTWRARWIRVLRSLLYRSAIVRQTGRLGWSYLSGEPLPPKISLSGASDAISTASNEASVTKDVSTTHMQRFIFALNENQRWWMGLDWTSALLPTERSPFSSVPTGDPSQQSAPLPPPTAFNLPAPTSVLVNGFRRNSSWRWEELEWRVVVHTKAKSGAQSAPRRLVRPLPSTASSSVPDAQVQAAANKAEPVPVPSSPDSSLEAFPEETSASSTDEAFTDPDGWIYADNKWEKQSASGGMRKYTRSRRWTRVAILEERVVDEVDDESNKPSSRPQDPQFPVQPASPSVVPQSPGVGFRPPLERGNSLRQRLRNAVSGTSS